MFGDVEAVKTGLLGGLDILNALLKLFRQSNVRAVDVIE